MDYRSINPHTEELLQEFPTASASEVDMALGAAAAGFRNWRQVPLRHRLELLLRLADLLERNAAVHARLMAEEMGKPSLQGETESRKCAAACRHYAEHAEEYLLPTSSGRVRPEPLGPVLAIMPWNFPFWQLFRFGAAALAAGNTIILKHAPNTPRCALRLVELFREAGAPEGVFQNLFLENEQAAGVIADPRVAAVTLTGSTRAGRSVAATAGAALKPVVLELGGSDPFIVFEDASMEDAVQTAIASRCVNSGQSCIAAKRFLVQRSAWDRFVGPFCEAMQNQKAGDPLDPETKIGPLARKDLRDALRGQVEATLARGGRILAQASEVPTRGFYFPATVIGDIPADSPAAREELFGPAATVIPFEDEDDALALANDTEYGLGASLWTANADRAQRLIPRIEAGNVFVNSMVKSEPRLPFGGTKQSGFGRELGREGILEFTNLKTVCME